MLYEPVTSETRIAAVTSGRIDLECGSTTDNAERRKMAAFSPITYVSAIKLLVERGAPVGSFRDLADRTVAVTAGTTYGVWCARSLLVSASLSPEGLGTTMPNPSRWSGTGMRMPSVPTMSSSTA